MHTAQDRHLREWQDIALAAARAGAARLLERYDKPHEIVRKGAVNLVTEADLASERAICAVLKAKTPEIPIMSEEQADSHQLDHEQAIWVVDPLDGTTNFAHGFPFFAVSIALLRGGEPLVGVVQAPRLQELFTARQGGGATLNGQSIQVSEATRLVESLVATGFPYERARGLKAITERLHRVLSRVQDLRRPGSAALDLSYVACGRLDAYYEVQLKPWDSAAGWLLVLEAGGRVTDMNGAPYSPFVPHLLASNGHVHQTLLPLM